MLTFAATRVRITMRPRSADGLQRVARDIEQRLDDLVAIHLAAFGRLGS